ncbi:hypothetical protein [Hymenobacter coccineus]|uniref:Uncharacterized protein n=1 Tax=Hymenobacter coccineus TaxID=1908235 RepID=A0A1G1SVS0_9BACT|nr:hypothetical protein [Hymenobacter coccineus]OGX82722.1 hypothetical protein BEN49_02300 [Hymenobacter coccineus]
MDTRGLLWLVGNGSQDEFHQALEQLDDGNNRYSELLEIIAESSNNRILFCCLEILIKRYAVQLQNDADVVIPLLLTCLMLDDGPVVDRAGRALNLLDKPGIEALLSAISASPDTAAAANYSGSLRSNSNVFLAAKQVLDLLGKQLDSPNEKVRYWAMIVLMDISPLRSWFDSRIQASLFEPLCDKLMIVAHAFRGIRDYDEWAAQYEDLLTQHLS